MGNLIKGEKIYKMVALQKFKISINAVFYFENTNRMISNSVNTIKVSDTIPPPPPRLSHVLLQYYWSVSILVS